MKNKQRRSLYSFFFLPISFLSMNECSVHGLYILDQIICLSLSYYESCYYHGAPLRLISLTNVSINLILWTLVI